MPTTKAPSNRPKSKGPKPWLPKDTVLTDGGYQKNLSQQQKVFLEEWVKGNSPGASAIRAGFAAPSYGYELSQQPHMIRLYKQATMKYEEALQTSREKVMGMLQEAFDMAKLQAEPMSMVAAAREIGKMCGYYAPVERRIKIEGNVTLDKMNKLSDQELLELVGHANEHLGNAIQQIAHEEDYRDAASPLAGHATGHSGDLQAPASEIPGPDDAEDAREAG